MIDICQGFDHIPALIRETGDEIHKVAPGMGEAVGQDGVKFFGRIAAKGITHLDGRAEA